MHQITQKTVWQVEGCGQLFDTREQAEDFLRKRNLAEWLEEHSRLTDDEAWVLVDKLREQFVLLPRSLPAPEILQNYRLKTGLVASEPCAQIVEYLKNAY